MQSARWLSGTSAYCSEGGLGEGDLLRAALPSVSGVKLRSRSPFAGLTDWMGMDLLRCKLTKSGGQHARAESDVGGRGVLVGPMADAAAAGDEDHGDGRDARP